MVDDTDEIVLNSARRLFGDLFPTDAASGRDETAWPASAWARTEELGLTLGLLSEEQGGFGLSAPVLEGIVRLVGAAAVPLPLPETMLAASLLARAGIEAPAGPLSIAAAGSELTAEAAEGGLRLKGRFPRVPWGGQAAGIAVVLDAPGGSRLVLLAKDDVTIAGGRNMAGEPRDGVTVDALVGPNAVAASPVSARELLARGAAMRAMQIAGAAERVLEMSVAYANERVQFGRPIGKFQAVQQSLAVMAGQVAAARGAAGLAAEALVSGRGEVLAMAVAKARAGEAAGAVASIAHQVHGAIGFTHEHSLHVVTRRLWSWRDEFGNDAHWHRVLGDAVIEAGADGLWPLVASF